MVQIQNLALIETIQITVCVTKVKSAVRKISSLFCNRGHACCVEEAKCYLQEVKSAVCYRLYSISAVLKERFAMWQSAEVKYVGWQRSYLLCCSHVCCVVWQRSKCCLEDVKSSMCSDVSEIESAVSQRSSLFVWQRLAALQSF